MRRVPLPNKSTPLLEDDGRTVAQAWYEFFKFIEQRGLSGLLDVDTSTAPTNGQVLVWNSTSSTWKPGTN